MLAITSVIALLHDLSATIHLHHILFSISLLNSTSLTIAIEGPLPILSL